MNQHALAGAVDLGALTKALTDADDGTFTCDVEGGCNLRLRSRTDNPDYRHTSLADCVETILQYVVAYFEIATEADAVAKRYTALETEALRLKNQNSQLIDANTRLVIEADEIRKEIRELRRAAKEHVDEHADD